MMKKLACLLSWHTWETETRGYLFEGSVYPLKVRTCKHCGIKQHEVLDTENMTASWAKSASAESESR